MRLHEAMVRRGHKAGDQSLQLKMFLEGVERTMRVRDQPELESRRRERTQGWRDVVVEKEVPAGGPFVIDVPCAFVQPRTTCTHGLENAARVAHEDRAVVDV